MEFYGLLVILGQLCPAFPKYRASLLFAVFYRQTHAVRRYLGCLTCFDVAG